MARRRRRARSPVTRSAYTVPSRWSHSCCRHRAKNPVPEIRTGAPSDVTPSTTARSKRAVPASSPGRDRQPSGPRNSSPSAVTRRGLTMCPTWRTSSSSGQS